MELRQLEYFLELGRTRSFTKAAPPNLATAFGQSFCLIRTL